MSTAQPPDAPDRPDLARGAAGHRRGTPVSRRRRNLVVGVVAGLVVWGVAALLSPEDGPGRHLAAAVLCALGAVAVAHLR
ncbi:hypothetical protein G3I38_30505, partial [Streptomyces sp. SID7958]|nr:hypothetical protein [Streptomyces sp. SID7958]